MTVNQLELAEVISETIENLSMMSVLPWNDEDELAPELQGTIEFTGKAGGELTIVCRESLAVSLAANLLGTSPDDETTQINSWDALAELLNVVCGNLVNVLFTSQSAFTISIPQINKIENQNSANRIIKNDSPGSTDNHLVSRLKLDEEPVEFALTIRET
jgi:CheY-specific phosphatase CheX